MDIAAPTTITPQSKAIARGSSPRLEKKLAHDVRSGLKTSTNNWRPTTNTIIFKSVENIDFITTPFHPELT